MQHKLEVYTKSTNGDKFSWCPYSRKKKGHVPQLSVTCSLSQPLRHTHGIASLNHSSFPQQVHVVQASVPQVELAMTL